MTPEPEAVLRLLAVGCGGQGVLTVARVLGDAAMRAGIDVRVGQLHGMAQRGGSVETTVLLGPGDSSFIPDCAAHVVVALEPLELLRARPKMSRRTKVVANQGRMVPFTMAQQGIAYPEVDQVLDKVRAVVGSLVVIDGPALTRASGSSRALNVVMIGALAGLAVLPFDADHVWTSIERGSPARFLKHNRRAFELGLEAAGAEGT